MSPSVPSRLQKYDKRSNLWALICQNSESLGLINHARVPLSETAYEIVDSFQVAQIVQFPDKTAQRCLSFCGGFRVMGNVVSLIQNLLRLSWSLRTA